MLDVLVEGVEEKKAQLHRLRPLSPHALGNLEHAYDLELTYTSNAIEGNTLTQIETNLVIEKGITVGGKKLKDHLEAIDHYDAIRYVREAARKTAPLTEFDIRNLHALVLKRSDPDIAGSYATSTRYMATDSGRHTFPSPAEVPSLMGEFAAWLRDSPATPETAFLAHRRLVDIHPFNDGNGRTARLLMNLVLIKGGYPPIAVRPEDRLAYLHALQESQAGRGDGEFMHLLYQRLDATLGEYLSALREALPQSDVRPEGSPTSQQADRSNKSEKSEGSS
jgi:Fic family protein